MGAFLFLLQDTKVMQKNTMLQYRKTLITLIFQKFKLNINPEISKKKLSSLIYMRNNKAVIDVISS